jgi:hypothetical protein
LVFYYSSDILVLGIKAGRTSLGGPARNKKQHMLSLNSKDFDARLFLSTVHKQTSFKELQMGYSRLTQLVEQRTETMKSLVKVNFDRFLNIFFIMIGLWVQKQQSMQFIKNSRLKI